MRITRRNTLVVLLVLVAAGGIVGTGAFSTVTADRSVSVTTAGDSSANVQFTVNYADHESLTDSGDGSTIGFNFDQVNLDAKTTYADVLNVTVNDADGESGDYKIEITNKPTNMNVEFENGGDTVTKSAGTKATADIILDTTGDTSTGNTTGNIEFTVTNQ